jgi:hypothetical protein
MLMRCNFHVVTKSSYCATAKIERNSLLNGPFSERLCDYERDAVSDLPQRGSATCQSGNEIGQEDQAGSAAPGFDQDLMNAIQKDGERGPTKPRPHGQPCGERFGGMHFNANVRVSQGAVDGYLCLPPT